MKNRFSVQIHGNVDFESEAVLLQKMQEVLAAFPEFTVTHKGVTVWQDGNGKPRKFNDDGTDYVEPERIEPLVDSNKD